MSYNLYKEKVTFLRRIYNMIIKHFRVKKEKEPMTFRALSRQTGSIGAEMYSSNLINILLAETKKKTPKRTALEIVDSVMNVNNLSKDVMDKYDHYRSKVANMDLAAAARYTSNFYKKGLSTYVPVGAIA